MAGSSARDVIRRLEVEKKRRSYNKKNYEARLLAAPPIIGSAVWLKTRRFKCDVVIPIQSIDHTILRPLKSLPLATFLNRVQEIGQQLIAYPANAAASKVEW